ncbi:MAG: AMP-binding protein [Pseudorhodobacter sp.]
MTGFRAHPAARLFGPDGDQIPLTPTPAAAGAYSERPVASALPGAFTGSFRIGAQDAPAPIRGFETLTSGSTGTPRRIARDFGSWRASFTVNSRLFGTGPGKRIAVIGPLSQSLALYGAVEALELGAEVHLLEGLRPDRMRRELARQAVTLLWAGPAALQLLLETDGPALPDLHWILLGGAKLDDGLRARLATLAPAARIREFYGAAEASFVTLTDADTPPHSVGKPYPNVEILLRNDQGHVATEGRVWVRSPYLFTGYASDPGPAKWRDGWLGLGEIARWEGGNLVLLGRIDRMFTTAGQNVFPEALESFMAGLPGMARVAVLPLPDERRGAVPVAVAMGDPAQEAAILKTLREEFGPLAAPRHIHWRQDWPLLPSGKTNLALLRQGLK